MVPQKNGALAVHRQNGHCRHTEWCITATQTELCSIDTENGSLLSHRMVHYRLTIHYPHTTELCSIATENGALPSQNQEWHISTTQHGALAPHRRVH